MYPLSELIASGDLIHWSLNDGSEPLDSETADSSQYRFNLIAAGIITIEPLTDDTEGSIVLSCGIHGNETAPIELVEQLFKGILSGAILLKSRLMIVLGNLPAIRGNLRFCDENLNRLFKQPPASHENLETQRAKIIMRCVDNFFIAENGQTKIHLDLHTAIRGSMFEKFAIYPFQSDGNWKTQAIAWLSRASIEAVLLANKPSGTFSCYTNNRHQALGFTIELGKARPFGSNEHASLNTFKEALIELLEHPQKLQKNDYQISCQVYNVVDEVLRHTDEQFALNLNDDFKNFTTLTNNYQLTKDGDNSYTISGNNKAVVFPNNKVPQGQRVALVVEPSSEF